MMKISGCVEKEEETIVLRMDDNLANLTRCLHIIEKTIGEDNDKASRFIEKARRLDTANKYTALINQYEKKLGLSQSSTPKSPSPRSDEQDSTSESSPSSPYPPQTQKSQNDSSSTTNSHASAPYSFIPKPKPKQSSTNTKPTTSAKSHVPADPVYTFTEQEKALVDEILRNEKDYYKILGVERKADTEEIKKAYKKKALKCHPDRNHAPKSTEAFRLVSAAFCALSDPKKRDTYDKYGVDDLRDAMFNSSSSRGRRRFHNGDGNDENDEDETDPAEEIFNFVFGGRRPSSHRMGARHMNGDDLLFNLFSGNLFEDFNRSSASDRLQRAARREQQKQDQTQPQQPQQPQQGFSCFSFLLQLLPILVFLVFIVIQIVSSSSNFFQTNFGGNSNSRSSSSNSRWNSEDYKKQQQAELLASYAKYENNYFSFVLTQSFTHLHTSSGPYYARFYVTKDFEEKMRKNSKLNRDVNEIVNTLYFDKLEKKCNEEKILKPNEWKTTESCIKYFGIYNLKRH